MPRAKIRLVVPEIGDEEIAAVTEVLRTGMLVQGEVVSRFERALAAYVGVEYAMAVSSGTAALHLALLATGIEPGDRVAVSAYSWPATANVIELCGAVPIFVDIDARSYNMAPAALDAVLEQNPDIRAIMVVHAFGYMANMETINRLASTRGVTVIEDAACALGARRNGICAGAYGRCGCFSFHPRKNITTGEGGAITTDDRDLARIVRTLRNHGQDPEVSPPDFTMPGFNYRLTEFQAALGLVQLRGLDTIVAKRRQLSLRYTEALSSTPVQAPAGIDEEAHVIQSYVVQLPNSLCQGKVISELRASEIECTIGTYHLPLIRYYREKYGYGPGDFPVADRVDAATLTLPMPSRMTPNQQDYVVSTLKMLLE